MINLSKTERIISQISGLLFILSIIAFLGYYFFGNSLVQNIYEGRSLPCLNQLIQYQHKYDLGHYQRVGTVVLNRLLVVFWGIYVVLVGFGLIVYRLFFSTKPLSIGWVLLWALSTQGVIHILNPLLHIYANHGFFRAGIIYQITNGYLPPQDPLFAGEVIHAPWGDLWLIAHLSTIFNKSPFIVYSVLNMSCLAAALYLIYRISRQICDNQKANILSALTALFSSTPIGRWLLDYTGQRFSGWQPELRAVPAFRKFPDICGDPLGIVFFCLFVYSIFQLYAKRPTLCNCVGLIISISGVVYFYTPFTPGIAIISAGLILFHLFVFRRIRMQISPVSSILLAVALLITGICFLPYWKTVSSGVGSQMELFSGASVLNHGFNVLLLMGLIAIVIWTQRQMLWRHSQTKQLVLLFIMSGFLIAGYLIIHVPGTIEYKLLLLGGICCGIIGGIALYFLGGQNRWLAAALFILFSCPGFGHIYRFGFKYGVDPLKYGLYTVPVYEKGCDLHVSDLEEQQMYDWIKASTPQSSRFLDTSLDIPVLAKRQLFIGLDRTDGKTESGYSIPMKGFWIRNGYDLKTGEFRTSIARNFYGYEETLPRQNVLEYLKQNDIFVVVRDNTDSMKRQTEGLKELFRSSAGRYRVFKVQ